MFIRNIVFVIAVASGFTLTAAAGEIEKIERAFGMTLGDTFDIRGSRSTVSNQTGERIYWFKPGAEFKTFSKYFVSITPDSQKIYTIGGTRVFQTSEECENELDIVTSILAEQYGDPVKTKDMFNPKRINVVIAQQENERVLLIECDRLRTNVSLTVFYVDKQLKALAEQEARAVQRRGLGSGR